MMPGVPSRNKGRGARRLVTNIFKRCTKCGLKVPMAEAKLHFRVNLCRGDGLGDYCIKCEKTMQAKWRAKKKAELEEEKARLGIVDKKKVKAIAPPVMRQCPLCGFECKKDDAWRYFMSRHQTCLKCDNDSVLNLNSKWIAAREEKRKRIQMHGCTLFPGRDGQRGAHCVKPNECEHYEDCLDVVANRGWIGWKTLEMGR